MKIIGTILIIGLILNFSPRDKKYSIHVKVESCSDFKMFYSQQIYLLKNTKVIDTVETQKYSKFLSFIGFSGWINNNNFKFKNLEPGQYHIKYLCAFDVDTLIPINITDKNQQVTVCFDILPKSKYFEPTPLDRLQLGDTLFINCYIASFGEFGGYDEGLWITKEDSIFYGQFYYLVYSYPISGDLNKLLSFYLKNKNEAKPIPNRFEINSKIQRSISMFLNEIKYYRISNGFSNAPESFIIYSTTDTILKIKNDFHYQPYLKLRERVLQDISYKTTK